MFMHEVLGVVRAFIKTISTYRSEPTAAEEARAMLQGVGSRFDFHINKTLCDLRYVSLSLKVKSHSDISVEQRRSSTLSSTSLIRSVLYTI